MNRQAKGQYKRIINILLEEYTNTQNELLSMASYQLFDEWAQQNNYTDGIGKEILFKNIIDWITDLGTLGLTDKKDGLLAVEVEKLKMHTWRLDYYMKRVQEYRIVKG